ncbi:hypothetical protein F2Q70_00043539 [Brassica cretica]|uniref:Uncharacterized protein n=1 Tax=Brassica cretica TaxID=69181 RepID=A0A8S9KLC7_BRACR|nr:hypothetical protein F2Q70_00043539 [Brassica cretica]
MGQVYWLQWSLQWASKRFIRIRRGTVMGCTPIVGTGRKVGRNLLRVRSAADSTYEHRDFPCHNGGLILPNANVLGLCRVDKGYKIESKPCRDLERLGNSSRQASLFFSLFLSDASLLAVRLISPCRADAGGGGGRVVWW